jgi:hypothetical protein
LLVDGHDLRYGGECLGGSNKCDGI